MVTIDEALDAFLAGQRERLSAKTFEHYEDVVFFHDETQKLPRFDPDDGRWHIVEVGFVYP
jgi:hypothetical protein